MDVFITGMSIWCSQARNLSEFCGALKAGSRAISSVKRIDLSHAVYRTRVAASLVHEERLQAEVDQTLICDLALGVANDALEDAGLQSLNAPSHRRGIVIGTSHGGNLAFAKAVKERLGGRVENIDWRLLLSTTPTIVGQVAKRYGFAGPSATISTACASGTNAIGRAMEIIKAGRADVMLAGGVDLYTELSFSGFNCLGALARDRFAPFDQSRDGMLLGDGAAFVVLEADTHAKKRKKKAYAIVSGHAIANEAFHPTRPRDSGETAAAVMRSAMLSAVIDPDDVDYINLHGTGTPANDESEMRAMLAVFGSRDRKLFMSSTKSMHGHTLGAAGAVECVATALAIRHRFAPPTNGLENSVETPAHFDLVRDSACPCIIRNALSNSFGFSGSLSCLVLKSTE